ncbi:hypothetical protein DICVIV_07661 [Dictyocaulus viviparus]|uniref:Uncharacterized protein n=1 Tax=Dictyocaulus viviparus TaxID=29172 RepID=A0A0D8XR47_DICVI|nr:hypothetical protein DICVIV_07661 [Dictyocaulus viviparus]
MDDVIMESTTFSITDADTESNTESDIRFHRIDHFLKLKLVKVVISMNQIPETIWNWHSYTSLIKIWRHIYINNIADEFKPSIISHILRIPRN